MRKTPGIMACIKLQKINAIQSTVQTTVQSKIMAPALRFIHNFLLATIILLLAETNQVKAQPAAKTAADLSFMRAYDGQYPGDAKLFDNPRFKSRLRKLLGNQYNYLVKDVWQVEIPIKVGNDFLYAWAMQAHSGGDPAATLLADFHTNTLYVEIIKDHTTILYSEDGSTALPKALADWATGQSSH